MFFFSKNLEKQISKYNNIFDIIFSNNRGNCVRYAGFEYGKGLLSGL